MIIINFNKVLDYKEAVERMQAKESIILIDKKMNSKDNPRIKYIENSEIDEIPKSMFYTLLGKKLIYYAHHTSLPSGLQIETYKLNKENCDKLDKL